MKPFLLLISLTILSVVSPAATPEEPLSLAHEHAALEKQRVALRAAATAFCTAVRHERIEGLPTADQLQRLSPLITPELHAIIERARVIQAKQQREQPDEKPEWIEGDLFSSLFEGVSTWEVGDAFHAPTVDATVELKQSFKDPYLGPVTWTDKLVFQLQNQRWLVNDIAMDDKWDPNVRKTLRSRLPGGIKETTDHDSRDGDWHVTFQREGDNLKHVTITDKKSEAKPMVLFGDKADCPCTFPTWLVWSPDGRMLALRPGDSPRFTDTLVFRLVGRTWLPVTLPELYAEERKTLAANGFSERESLKDAEGWQDSSTLVIHYFGNFTKGDEGDGFDKFMSVRIDQAGQASVVRAVDTPPAQEQSSFSSFIDLPWRYVIGGYSNGQWLNSEAAGKRLTADATNYRVFTLKGEMKSVTAAKATPDEDLVPDIWMQNITPELQLEEQVIGVNAPWNPMPRKATQADVTQDKYVTAVRDLLIGKGIAKPKVKIKQLLRVDLDGDGEEEVLISATRYVNEAELISAKAGDYSLVALRRVVAGKVRTQFVVGEVYPKSDVNGLLNTYEVGGLLDLDGDGTLEVIVRSYYYEGGGTQVWRLEHDKLVQVVSVIGGA
jgi:hypothetical protein